MSQAQAGIVKKHGHHERRRMYPGVRGRAPHNRKARVEEARERLDAWTKLSPQEQLKVLDRRPGESKKQRARLGLLIEKSKNQSKADPKGALATDQTIASTDHTKAKDRRAQEQSKRPSR